jgi:hypothetical protein
MPVGPLSVKEALRSIAVRLQSEPGGICVNARDARAGRDPVVKSISTCVASLEAAVMATFASANFTVNHVQGAVKLAAVRASGRDREGAAMRSPEVFVDEGKFHRDQSEVCPMSAAGAFLGFNLSSFGYHLSLVRKPPDYRDGTPAERARNEHTSAAGYADLTHVWIPPKSFYIVAGTARYAWLHKPANLQDKMFARVGLVFDWGFEDVVELCKRIIYCLIGL